MIKQIRTSKFTKVVAWYLAIMMFVEMTQPMRMYALTSGPTQPEFNSFTPIGTSDMVDLTSGDFNYNIPVMDVGGYPLNLSYNSGVTTDQEASWVGLGWNLNVGQIERQVRGLPDDFKGDEIQYENNLRDNITVGTHFGVNGAFFGWDGIKPGVGLGIQYNNYEGITFKPSYGVSFEVSDNVAVGLNFTSSVGEGASVNPSVSISKKMSEKATSSISSESLKGTGTIGLGFSSRKGIENLNLSASVKRTQNINLLPLGINASFSKTKSAGGIGGSISFNNMSYTPSKRIGFENLNLTFNAALGSEIMGPEIQGQITGYGSFQRIAPQYKNKKEKAFGYENTEYKRLQPGILDFNRENERTINENTLALPVTNYTYDTYNIEGQGVSGMFRPYRSQVSYVYNDAVTDYGVGLSLGMEFGVGDLAHGGVDFKVSPSTSSTGGWFNNNRALSNFAESSDDRRAIDYEPYTYKLVGAMVVDPEQSIYFDKIHQTKALRLGLGGNPKNAYTNSNFMEPGGTVSHPVSQIKRTKRYLRNQLVHKVTNKEAERDPFIIKNENAKPHHTAGIKVVQTDGSTYVYGRTAYNKRKIEATFDVSDKTGNNSTGLVEYNNASISDNNTNVSDKFLNKITTPEYAHSYLITSILSTDYEDIDNNGPSIKDLGSYTQFDYLTIPNYQWRMPFQSNTATYNDGLISNKDDEKGTYLYGVKELTYLKKIVTKTHVAFFELEDREDAIGVAGEHGGAGAGRMKRIKSIRLYSRPEVTNAEGNIFDPRTEGNLNVKPIKTAHFEYDYSLCKNTPNSLADGKGKLTLKRVYFTYRDSNIGKYTPYVFNYGLEKSKNKPVDYSINNDPINNPDYNSKGFDIWGNYKNNPAGSGNINSPLSTTEYPFVDQNNQQVANENTGTWSLKSVQLPSGGVISIETESDDYQFVQNRKAMQMFKVVGSGNNSDASDLTTNLYSGNNHNQYIYVKLNESQVLSRKEFIDKYLDENLEKAIQFRFLLNMTGNNWQYDYVSGYFEIGENELDGKMINVVNNSTHGIIAAIPLKKLHRDGGTNGNAPVNPIVKTGWGFGRTYLNRAVYSIGGNMTNTNFVSIVQDLVGSIGAISEIFTGPNKALQDKGCARTFKPEKSWVRLENPNGRKLGGGLRVKSVKLSDEWGSMLGNTTLTGGTDLSSMEYGQVYSYDDENGKSSGVATYEPNGSAENALLEPFYPKGGSYAENIAAPKENNFVEKPFGENFFPSPRVTYSRVEVKNLDRKINEQIKVKKHATGKVVTKHYTSYDFPTKVENTEPNIKNGIPHGILGALAQLASFRVRSHLTMSQGYSIETNDMNGKIKSQEVYQEGNNYPISKVEYKYNIDESGNLDNELLTINEKGEVKKQLLGLDYDMINDFNESRSETLVAGFDGNLAAFLVTVFPAFTPTILPKLSYNENQLRTAVTTKHIHKTGILKEKIAYDLGSTVSTKNIAWDASSGEVILTETVNEYNDKYYSFSYPAYWMYGGMGLASTNIGITGELSRNKACDIDPTPYFKVTNPLNTSNSLPDLSLYFQAGDELMLEEKNNPNAALKVWVLGLNTAKTGLLLMDRNGNYIDNCGENETTYRFKIVRSGYRNLQTGSMASVTSMINPVQNNDGSPKTNLEESLFSFSGSNFNPRIINASAVVYKDFWKPQADTFVYPTPQGGDPETSGEISHPYKMDYNPYLWNTKGDWKAEKSYAYLTGRNASNGTINNPRNEGFFTKFSPFYKLTSGKWQTNVSGWQYASSVTQYSPYGTELENKDALDRYSSAQYGYNNNLPMAVASNAKYREMGFESFEENSFDPKKHFVFKNGANGTAPYLSAEHSHTGKRSVKVVKSQPVKLVRKLKAPTKIAELRGCNYSCNNLIEYILIDEHFDAGQPNNMFRKYILRSKCNTNWPVSVQPCDYENNDFGNCYDVTTPSSPIYGPGAIEVTFHGIGENETTTIPIIVSAGGYEVELIYKPPFSSNEQIHGMNVGLICN